MYEASFNDKQDLKNTENNIFQKNKSSSFNNNKKKIIYFLLILYYNILRI